MGQGRVERIDDLNALAERDGGWRCHYCATELEHPETVHEEGPSDCRWGEESPPERLPFATRDHRVPRTRGGGDDLDNLVLACQSCNSSKGQLTEAEYFALLSILDSIAA